MIEGSCHCGAVRWRFEGEPDGATICNCTVCRRYGVLWAYLLVLTPRTRVPVEGE